MSIGATCIKAANLMKRKNLTWWIWRKSSMDLANGKAKFFPKIRHFRCWMHFWTTQSNLHSPKNGAILLSKIQSYLWAKSGSLIRANTVQLSRADLNPRAHWVKWAPVWDGIPTAFYWSHFRLNCAQTAQAPGEVESYNGPAVLNWHFEAETDFYLFQH